MSQKWLISKAPKGFSIHTVAGAVVGNVLTDGKHWRVEFHDAPKLNWAGGISVDAIMGYIRGVERAIDVYGEETRK